MGASHPPVGLRVIKSVLSQTVLSHDSRGYGQQEDSHSRLIRRPTPYHRITMLKYSNEYSQQMRSEKAKNRCFNIWRSELSLFLQSAGYNIVTPQ